MARPRDFSRSTSPAVKPQSRSAYTSVKRVEQPAPAPRFSRTPAEVGRPPPERGEGGDKALAEWGFDPKQVEGLKARGLGFKA